MVLSGSAITSSTPRHREAARGLAMVLAVAVVGLFFVKWQPYYLKSFTAASQHMLGPSILTGTAAAPPVASLQAAWGYALAYFLAVWQAVVLGMVLGATIEASLSPGFLARLLGADRPRSSLFGGLLALPGMMCTCCATPVAIGLRRAGASMGAGVAFFLGNPTLNPAVLVFLLFTLGWQWALLRLVFGSLLVWGGAALASRLAASNGDRLNPGPGTPLLLEGSWPRRWVRSITRLGLQLLPEYVIVVGLLGFARVFLFPAASPTLGQSWGALIALAVAGTLFVIPTAGEVPILQTMQAFGLGAVPAGVLLLTLAPVSLPSLLMMARVLPARVLLLLGGLTALTGLAAGLVAGALRL